MLPPIWPGFGDRRCRNHHLLYPRSRRTSTGICPLPPLSEDQNNRFLDQMNRDQHSPLWYRNQSLVIVASGEHLRRFARLPKYGRKPGKPPRPPDGWATNGAGGITGGTTAG